MAVAAQTTIALRVWSLALPLERESAWGQAEMLRMVAEKQKAYLDSALAIQRAMLRQPFSTDLVPLLAAGLRPYHRKTRANVARLRRRL